MKLDRPFCSATLSISQARSTRRVGSLQTSPCFCSAKLGRTETFDALDYTLDATKAQTKGFDTAHSTTVAAPHEGLNQQRLEECGVYDPKRILPHYVVHFRMLKRRSISKYVSGTSPDYAVSTADYEAALAVIKSRRGAIVNFDVWTATSVPEALGTIGDYIVMSLVGPSFMESCVLH